MAVHIGAETYLRFFQRSPLPGPGGAIVGTTIDAPLYQYASLHIGDIDVPWAADSIDVQLSAWGNVNMGETALPGRVDGDVTVASVRHRFGPAYANLGRQVFAGGAARVTHFDGLAAGVALPFGLGADGYGGFTVLPRWDARPGYYVLGSAVDTMLFTPEAAPDPDPSRVDQWVVGGRLHYDYAAVGQIGASFHEQHEFGELGRRNLGADLRVTPHEVIGAHGNVILDGDAWGLTEARAVVDLTPVPELMVAAEFFHATPALFLSRQSILSAFSTEPFDEVGGDARYEIVPGLRLGAGGYVDVFGDGELGARIKTHLRLAPPNLRQLVLRLGYRRVMEVANGYHAPRIAMSYRVIEPLTFTADAYWYAYDDPIRNVSHSWIGGGTGEWAFDDRFAVMAGGTVGRSPYALFDVQALARLRMNLDWRIQ